MIGKILLSLVKGVCALGTLSVLSGALSSAQTNSQQKSVGGTQHEDNILGVRVGMDVPTALQTIFVNSGRKPGQEKPDAKRAEGRDQKDIRVLYKGLKEGEVQIVFAEGKWVKEIVLDYAARPHSNELRLPVSSFIGAATDIEGRQADDRYSVGFTSDKKEARFWWRDEKTPEGYRVRVGFISKKIKEEPSAVYQTIVRKIVALTPGDEDEFLKAVGARTAAAQ